MVNKTNKELRIYIEGSFEVPIHKIAMEFIFQQKLHENQEVYDAIVELVDRYYNGWTPMIWDDYGHDNNAAIVAKDIFYDVVERGSPLLEELYENVIKVNNKYN